MSDLNTAFIGNDLANDLMTNLGCDDDFDEGLTSATAIVDCRSKRELGFIKTTYSVSEPSLDGENSVKECVWETCCTAPAKLVNSHVSKRKLQHNKGQQMEVASGDIMVCTNHIKQKTDGTSKNQRITKTKKKTKNCSAEKVNMDYKNDLCLPFETAILQEHDANVPSEVSIAAECVENVSDLMTELPSSFEHDSCTQQMRIIACSDAEVGMSLTLEQQNEKNVFSEAVVEDHHECAEATALQLQGIGKAVVMTIFK